MRLRVCAGLVSCAVLPSVSGIRAILRKVTGAALPSSSAHGHAHHRKTDALDAPPGASSEHDNKAGGDSTAAAKSVVWLVPFRAIGLH
jgi:hypothetical protein